MHHDLKFNIIIVKFRLSTMADLPTQVIINIVN